MTDEVNESGDSDVAKVVRACGERLNPSAEWTPFEGYPGSLALCVLDAIWSVSTRYPITRGVIQRYRGQRRWQGNPDEDGLPELLAFYGAVGGVDSFIDTVGTRNRVSTQPDAMRKGEAVFLAATALHNLGIDTAEQFRSADGTPLGEQVREAWCAVPGPAVRCLMALSPHARRVAGREAGPHGDPVPCSSAPCRREEHRCGPRCRSGPGSGRALRC